MNLKEYWLISKFDNNLINYNNWKNYINAYVIFFSGKLQIAEVKSRFTNIKEFITLVSNFGFTLAEKVSSTINFEYKIMILLL